MILCFRTKDYIHHTVKPINQFQETMKHIDADSTRGAAAEV
ncbi:MAG: hypothetical protein R3A45_12620 [Bdellovibrionota bacterium]